MKTLINTLLLQKISFTYTGNPETIVVNQKGLTADQKQMVLNDMNQEGLNSVVTITNA